MPKTGVNRAEVPYHLQVWECPPPSGLACTFRGTKMLLPKWNICSCVNQDDIQPSSCYYNEFTIYIQYRFLEWIQVLGLWMLVSSCWMGTLCHTSLRNLAKDAREKPKFVSQSIQILHLSRYCP